MVNVLLCGGSGTRMWPLSRNRFPKQFVPLLDKFSLYEQTLQRNAVFCDSFTIVTNAELVFMAVAQFEKTLPNREMTAILESAPRNTAPAIALAAFAASSPDEILFVTPSDHRIVQDDNYMNAIAKGAEAAKQGRLITFGLVPRYPETGYGYIEANQSLELTDGVFPVTAFKEKPDVSLAQSYISKGNFFWNSGMFMFSAGLFLSELERCRPDIYQTSRIAFAAHVNKTVSGHTTVSIPHDEMMNIPSESIDYAVMEKSQAVATVISDFSWNDLGSFDSLYDLLDKDIDGNTRDDNFNAFDSQNNLVISSDRKIIALDMHDSIIIDTDDALLVASRGSSQSVKKIVDYLKTGDKRERQLANEHTTVYRPWGYYKVLETGTGYKIKKIGVTPGERLSLQKHEKRSEHWVVVRGVAEVTLGSKKCQVCANESVYIPIGEVHRLENKGIEELLIIETQVGSYVEEDDIIRIEDDYKRQ